MTYLRRIMIFALWSGAAIILFWLLMLFFTFGDCRSDNIACIDHQRNAAQRIPIVTAGIYGVGIGVVLQRWFLNRVR